MTLLSVRPSFGSIDVKTPLALPGERIGIMGGSFNPPHDGHVIAARAALKRARLARLWWLVTPGNPLKQASELAPLDDRMLAARQLCPEPRMIMTSFETELATPYTAATLRFLTRRYPSTRFVWVMGADNLATFHRWQHWREIARAMPIIVVDRPGWRHRALSAPAARWLAPYRTRESRAGGLADQAAPAWCYLTTRLSGQSSTALRNRRAAPTYQGQT